MSEFNSLADTALQLKTEGETISLDMAQGVPSANKATISWNIPTPALGCGGKGAFAGMVVLLHTQPLGAANIPKSGTIYVADPTADIDMHTGDKIGDAIVIGAFYECDKQSDLSFTTSFVLSDLDPKQNYYVAGYATDCQRRYHSDGVRAYSDSYGSTDNESFPASQIFEIKSSDDNCIIPTDGTGLLPGAEYQFDIVIDNTYPIGSDFKIVEANIDGLDAGTYDQLVDQINKHIALVDNPPQSPIAPNAGQFYWNASDQTLFQFDGMTHNPIPALVEPTDPSIIGIGDYWYDPDTKVLSRWNIPTPTGWNVISYVATSFDPTAPTCDSYWNDGIIGRRWNGTVWCDKPTIIQTTDPDNCNIQPCGSWWFDEVNSILNEWNATLNKWDPRDAIYWDEAPNQLSSGTYWFDLTNSALNVSVGTAWTDISAQPNVFIQEEQPITTVTGVLWYNPSTETLQEFDGTVFSAIPVLVWATDPSIVESCDAWWRSTDNELLLWDAVGNEWVPVTHFTVSMTDPVFPSALTVGHIWYNPSTQVLQTWDGGAWVVESEVINTPTNPTDQTFGDGWFNTSTNVWSIWDTPNSGWNVVDPVDVVGDPALISNGAYWYDTTNNLLNVRNGIVWMNVIFSTSPFTPTRGSQWFNTTTNTLLQWDGLEYIPAELLAVAKFGACGIDIVSTQLGSSTFVMVPVMNAPSCTANGFADFSLGGVTPSVTCGMLGSGGLTKEYPVRHLTLAGSLWDSITDTVRVANPIIGADGVSGTPSYETLGVGDDGTPDERRELAHSIRAQLGYPVVEVELTKYQIDTAIQGAIESFRKRSSMAYRRGFYFLDIQPQQQNYVMSNIQNGYNKIVNVMAAYRFTSAFLSSAHGGGVYGQVVLQHLYNMGTYDLTSFHLVSQYVEQLQDLFATRLVYNWNEQKRELGFFQSFTRPERVLLDCTIERTEQDLMTDRYTKSWIERYALAESMTMLARIRGKYGSLPGAGGGVSLDASDLMATAETYRQELMDQLDDYVVQDMEGLGMGSTFVFGG